MPKRTDIHKIMVIGSGPIIIGQAAEFDYSGTQACLALKELDYEVVLVNSNPATIMTDKEIADQVYLEPITLEFVSQILRKEHPDAILPTLGGQQGLNMAMELSKSGILDELHIELLGTKLSAIDQAEDREQFKALMEELNEPVPASGIARTVDEALAFAEQAGYPVIVRPAFTMGGTGGGIAETPQQLHDITENGLALSPVTQVLIEQSIAGYKEIEFEVMRDAADNAMVVCNMENFDPVGIHTGDSIVYAPVQTLADREVQLLRDAALKIIRALKIEGGCNVQLALDPNSFNYYIIEVNPRVSRSSALASKATGYPIAKMAAKIAVGLHLDEIKNPVTGTTYAEFEPALDYVVCKIPRWPFDKFTHADRRLGTQMKATGEVMAIAPSFEQAMMKAIRGVEMKLDSFIMPKLKAWSDEEVKAGVAKVNDERLLVICEALRRGIMTIDEIHDITMIDTWFLNGYKNIVDMEHELAEASALTEDLYLRAKKMGFLDKTIEQLSGKPVGALKRLPVYKTVDTCAAEFDAETPYYYSTFDDENEVKPSTGKKKVLVLGSGPIRIGQGIEFDYCSVHSVWALKELGCETVIINNNPETVSTDFDTADRLYFEPLTPEDVEGVVNAEKPDAAIVQFGGQTAINLAAHLEKLGVPILGTQAWSIDAAEDREKFDEILEECHIPRPKGETVFTEDEAVKVADRLGYPVLVRPSYVLGGQGMEIAYSEQDIREYMQVITRHKVENPVLVDKYMMGREIEVDAICDGEDILIPGIMEHFERAGVHSGDSISMYPSLHISSKHKDTIIRYTRALSKSLKVLGLVNIQFVLYNDQVYIIEVNPRSSRTVPYISKITGVPMIDLATRCMFGEKLRDMEYGTGLYPERDYYAVKVPVFSFQKLRDLDTQLGPEMKSTGEVLGVAKDFKEALYKGLLGAGYSMHKKTGKVVISVRPADKQEAIPIAEKFEKLGYELYATRGTANTLNNAMVATNVVYNAFEPELHPNILDMIENGEVDYVISTSVKGRHPELASVKIRRAATEHAIPCLTAIDTANALLECMESGMEISKCKMIDINDI